MKELIQSVNQINEKRNEMQNKINDLEVINHELNKIIYMGGMNHINFSF